ncbi:hypothetical protein CBS147343_2153 [Aspergillus niger]|uniref:Uncharacterized protein n=2 Tax=Aspergillus niger TaxID=5061 RepID=G3Y190_ASPNA|nr:hypothetical protein ASPNIDRAFT_36636 [Aspergillus niger ATCC 1015]KAI2866041.1 hypothetical protein CBS12448_1564 [Aspergillus niger]KAI2922561.1 hypothetical protein CBS147371_2133 [Aspergillus niger]KAI2946447.1 hypothetical protein CBS147321_3388 [Aspergillus niger]KAI2958611.1 hypothetical protein CBS147322_1515 [Aspergillus niger]
MAGTKRSNPKKKPEARPSTPTLEAPAQETPSPGPSEHRGNKDKTLNPRVRGAQKGDDTLYPEYSRVFLTKQKYLQRVQGMNRLLMSGSRGWESELTKISQDYEDLYIFFIYQWVFDWGIKDVGTISKKDMNLVIGALDGYCIQEDWTTLQRLLPPLPAPEGRFLETLINKAIATKVLPSSFQYLDGKTGPTDQDEDESFATKLQYLYDRFFKTNPNFATLWKQQTHRLANSITASQAPGDLDFGQENVKRLRGCAPPLADGLLASRPFRLLLREPLSPEETLSRRTGLVKIFEEALRLMCDGETRVGGQFRMEQLPQLGSLYKCGSPYMMCWDETGHADETDFDGRKILLVVRPAIVYTHSEPKDAGSGYTSVSSIAHKAMVIVEDCDGVTDSTKLRKEAPRRPTMFVEDRVCVNTAE